MSVLLDNRKETPFAVRDNALDMRRYVTELCFRRFGVKPRKEPKLPSNWEKWSPESQQAELAKREVQRKQAEEFDKWFIYTERTVLDQLLRKIIFDIDEANTMRPQFLFECDKQRELQDEAIGLCSNLIRELNYIGDTIPANKNFITKVVKIVDKEIALIRGWRKSCNESRNKITK